MASPTSVIGARVPRIEGEEKVTGKARYAADINLPGMLWAKILRSPYPHARILRVDTSRAEALPGVRAVLTGGDVKGHYQGKRIYDMPVLCWDKVLFIGDRVAAVAADTADTAEEALQLIDIEYEELPAVFDPLEAMKPEAPRLHDDVAGYAGAPTENLATDLNNGLTRVTWGKGDVEQGFAQADRVIEHVFRTPTRHQGYLEPQACIVDIDSRGKVQVWVSSKGPYGTRTQISRSIGLPEEQVRINPINVGGDFGGKGGAADVPIAYFLAKKAGRPVKIVMTYTEELTAANPAHPAVITIRSGLTNDGRIVARQMQAVHNSGAYGAQKPISASIGGAGTAGPYRIDNTAIEALQIYTNTAPNGFWRAPGALQAMFAVECHMDLLAQEMGMDPAEFRLMNMVSEGAENALGVRLVGVKARETLQAALDAAGWGTPKPSPTYGRGIAMYERFTGAGAAWLGLRAETDGTLTITTVAGDQGSGLRTVLTQTVAEEMGVPLADIEVEMTDTDSGAFPVDIGFGGSRSTNVGSNAAIEASRELRERLLPEAAEMLECSTEELAFSGGRFAMRMNPSRSVPIGEVMSRATQNGPVSVAVKVEVPMQRSSTSFVAQVAEVEIDTETGQVKLVRFVTAHDVGTIINPTSHQGQIDGGVVMAIGQGMMEEIISEDGRVVTANLGDYKLPTVADIPELVTVLVQSDSGPAPYEAKAIAEMANNSAPAAIANAVADAVGVRLYDIPVTAEKVLEGLARRQ